NPRVPHCARTRREMATSQEKPLLAPGTGGHAPLQGSTPRSCGCRRRAKFCPYAMTPALPHRDDRVASSVVADVLSFELHHRADRLCERHYLGTAIDLRTWTTPE